MKSETILTKNGARGSLNSVEKYASVLVMPNKIRPDITVKEKGFFLSPQNLDNMKNATNKPTQNSGLR